MYLSRYDSDLGNLAASLLGPDVDSEYPPTPCAKFRSRKGPSCVYLSRFLSYSSAYNVVSAIICGAHTKAASAIDTFIRSNSLSSPIQKLQALSIPLRGPNCSSLVSKAQDRCRRFRNTQSCNRRSRNLLRRAILFVILACLLFGLRAACLSPCSRLLLAAALYAVSLIFGLSGLLVGSPGCLRSLSLFISFHLLHIPIYPAYLYLIYVTYLASLIDVLYNCSSPT
ncbi:hypothetical protein OE88DRAFT_1424829 [Heliocybe sulcata]|uniref:Uncharacterized protein n=1 Tax=Heliocybe sulcata TaxID=5364 RepID=A0A5C3N714_9AGAM|nr:hypothetical protein OE88DRAFT_1424829 [Heliocybe sulcata]